MIVRSFMMKFAEQFQGTPYLWGGSGARRDGSWGFDCSGFVIFLLKPFGLLPAAGDWTAQMLSRMFEETLAPEPGDLAFYGKNEDRVQHVMLYLGAGQVIGAAGGTSKTVSVARALGRKACVKVARMDYRPDLVGYRNILAPRWRSSGMED